MSTMPPRPQQAHDAFPIGADPAVRAIGLLALVVILAALIGGLAWSRTLGVARGNARGSERIGATLAPLSGQAVVVDSIRASGAARRGGLLVGDVIEAVDGRPISSVEAADHAFLARTLDIRVRRGKRELDVHLDAGGGDGRGQQGPVDRG
ncbi:PDZ domain-containing protein [Sphingomonas phyllosphaerae]|uniref:PDZ domain-containing protein n=1 Tax=Sphingomonas phyllosphaerae TaxID=257003 RepID=UPI00138B058E|nr:PDZ domain-containing protein [Sphingomonas phyllosphaerae]